MRTIIIGDIHGCFDEFNELLDKISFDQEKDKLILLGDLIDRGPFSFNVVEKVMNLKNEMGDRCVVIRGNHEQMLLDSVNGFGEDKRIWIRNGADTTIDSLLKNGTSPKAISEWISTFPYYYEEERFICTHAGIPSTGLDSKDTYSFIWDRSIIYEGWYKGKFLICGHTPLMNCIYYNEDSKNPEIIKPGEYDLPKTGYIDIDTGCVFGYKLTAMIIEGDKYKIEEVKSHQKLID